MMGSQPDPRGLWKGKEEKIINRAMGTTLRLRFGDFVRTSFAGSNRIDACGYGNVKIVDDFRKAMKIVEKIMPTPSF